MASSVRIICPNLKCRAILSVPSSARGKTVRCRQCAMRVNVPKPAAKAVENSAGGEADGQANSN